MEVWDGKLRNPHILLLSAGRSSIFSLETRLLTMPTVALASSSLLTHGQYTGSVDLPHKHSQLL